MIASAQCIMVNTGSLNFRLHYLQRNKRSLASKVFCSSRGIISETKDIIGLSEPFCYKLYQKWGPQRFELSLISRGKKKKILLGKKIIRRANVPNSLCMSQFQLRPAPSNPTPLPPQLSYQSRGGALANLARPGDRTLPLLVYSRRFSKGKISRRRS